MIRRHFFLVGALAILAAMVFVGAVKLMTPRAGSAGGGAERSAAAPAGTRPAGEGAPVTLARVQVRPFTDFLEVLGVAKGRQSVTLTAATTQLVHKVRFVDGQSVQGGAVLVELRATEEDAALAQSRAKLVQAERAYERYRRLGDQGFVSKAAIDQYQADYLAARADVAAAVARQNDHLIRAPFAGVVGLSDVAPGALVNPGAPIVTLDDLSAIRVDFQVPEQYLRQVAEGQPIDARVDALPGETVAGRVAHVDTRIDERTRAVTARAEFPNPGRRLKPGMMIRMGLARGQRSNPAVPESALLLQGDSAFVYVVHRQEGRAIVEQRAVVAGARQGGFVEILDGVRPGDELVADGLNKIQPGQHVRIAGAQAGAHGS